METQQKSPWGMALAAFILGLVVGYYVGGSQQVEKVEPTENEEEGEVEEVTSQETEIKFGSHIQLNLPEQDVFIESKEEKGKVVRIEGVAAQDEENLSKTVYAASAAIPHDPFKLGENPLGPFAKGKSLEFTLRDWLNGEGSGTYTVTGDEAKLDLTFDKLVKNGVYTLWCSRITFPPNAEIVDRPCGAADGSENSFTADGEGKATFALTFAPLPESSKETASVIALAYHSDGKTYGEKPGDFGLNSHVQLAFLFPVPEGDVEAESGN